jgi:hypothetical protein
MQIRVKDVLDNQSLFMERIIKKAFVYHSRDNKRKGGFTVYEIYL